MKLVWLLAASSLALAAPAIADMPASSYAAAVGDSARPAADTARDAARKPAEMMAFAGVKPGDKVVDLIPGGGYFTRIFSAAVGPGGHVYAATPPAKSADAEPAAAKIAADPHYANVSVIDATPPAVMGAGPVDIIWTAQNYHDLHLARLKLDVPAYDKALFAALKPGGVLVIVDHAAEAGSGLRDPDKLHRIDEAVVKQEVESAGFVLDAESDTLRNPADPHTALVFDPSIRGKTDQFVLRFKKPG
jgi:predicted methyltransferase